MIVRQIMPDDEGAIKELFSRCFGKEVSHEEWQWKYMDSPWGSTAAVTVDDGVVIAHYGGIRMKFYFKGKTFTAFQPCDVMTHPRYRARIFSKRGAMVKAGEYFYESNPMDFAFGFPNERHALLGTKQLGYTEHGYVTVLKKKVSRSRFLWRPLLKLKRGWDSVDSSELNTLWNEVKDRHNLSIDKNSRYILWRYAGNPVRQYEPLVVRHRYKKNIIAFAVISVRETDLLVPDFFAVKPSDMGVLLRLLENTALEYGLKDIVLWANPGENIFKSLVCNGFLPEKGVPYIFKIMNTTASASFLFENYYYRMGDYDAS